MMMSGADNIFQKDASSWHHRAYPFRICFKLHILLLAKDRCSTFVTLVTKDPMGSCHHADVQRCAEVCCAEVLRCRSRVVV